MTIFITKRNVDQLAKVQSASSHVDRDEVALMWDELSKKQRRIAENIDIDLDVHTSEPSTVPDKWKDSIVEIDGDMDHLDIVKNIIANPSRQDVYEQLVEQDPPEPLMLWWLEHVFSDIQYAKLLSDICRHALFKTDTDYLWGAIAFGVEAGVGKFSWPDTSSDIPKAEQDDFNEVLEETDIPEKELKLVWDDVKGIAQKLVEGSPEEAEEVKSVEPHGETTTNDSSLLDLP